MLRHATTSTTYTSRLSTCDANSDTSYDVRYSATTFLEHLRHRQKHISLGVLLSGARFRAYAAYDILLEHKEEGKSYEAGASFLINCES